MQYFVLTTLGGICFGWGVALVFSLRRLERPADVIQDDPFYTWITLLFSTGRRSQKFQSLQRRAIWLFCLAILLLYLARASVVPIEN